MTSQLILLFVCIIFSAFFSSAETALFSISRVRALHLAKGGKRVDEVIVKMKQDSHKLLSTILIGNNLVNIGGSSLATALAMDYFQSNAVGISTGIMTLIILVVGEIFPKSFATRNNIFVSRIVIIPLFWMSKAFFPLIMVLNFIPRLLRSVDGAPPVTEDELMTMVEVVEEEGEIKEEEKEFISNIFEFDDTSASEIMTPRADMYVLDINDPLDIKAILQSGFTRIPVMDGHIDNIIGVLNIKDLFASYHDTCENTMGALDVREVIRDAYFIPVSKKLDSLLHVFKRIKLHIGIVVDEHGGVCGLVTMEDVLEEIVGEISDETDRIDPHIVTLKGKKWIVLGKTEIDEINKALELVIPESSDYDTFSGFVLDKLGRIPKVGESIKIGKYTATVKDREGNRIRKFVLKEL
ncbi:MAG: hemolysin family protein [Desulfobacterium sp.]